VLSKIDKLSRTELDKSIVSAKKHFFWQDIIPISSTKWTNMNELKKYLKSILLS
jgi:GTPase Era involved in 16S rRNA processing